MIIAFKQVSPEDWEKMKEIRLTGLQTDPHAFGSHFETEAKEGEAYWKERLSDKKRFFYVAEINSSFVATVGMKKVTDNNLMMVGVYTLPEHRGKGLSKKLIDMTTENARESGVEKVHLLVSVRQESAISLYKKCGFEIIRTEKDQKLGGGTICDEFYMEKFL